MKFSTVASTIFGAALFFASKAVADVDHFDLPSPNSVFRPGSSIQFVIDEMPAGDDHERVYAKLYRENGGYVRTIRSWFNDEVDGDDYAFSWPVDQNLSSGRYYVEICTDDRDDISRSFIFELDSNRGTANKGSNGNSRGNRGNSRGAKGNRH